MISLLARLSMAAYSWWLRRYWLTDKITEEE